MVTNSSYDNVIKTEEAQGEEVFKFDFDLLPTVTPDTCVGCGGELKALPCFFAVTEVPLITPSGSGTHLWVTIRKCGIDTKETVLRLQRLFQLASDKDIGFSGLKDKLAVTIQVFSIPAKRKGRLMKPDEVTDLIHSKEPQLRVINLDYHNKKLKLNQHKGNRFHIVVSSLKDLDRAYDRCMEIMKHIQKHCDNVIPNYYGPQRYGSCGSNVRAGFNTLTQARVIRLQDESKSTDANPDSNQVKQEAEGSEGSNTMPTKRKKKMSFNKRKKKFKKIHNWIDKFKVHAIQSHLFNEILAYRILDHTFNSFIPGDVVCRQVNGRLKLSRWTEGEAVQQGVSHTAVLFGANEQPAVDEAGKLEQRVLAKYSLSLEDFAAMNLRGERRASFLHLDELNLRIDKLPSLPDYLGRFSEHEATLSDRQTCEGSSGLLFSFELPPGCYATSVMREFMKVALMPGANRSS